MEDRGKYFKNNNESAAALADSIARDSSEEARHNEREALRYLIIGGGGATALLVTRLPTGSWIDLVALAAIVFFSLSLLFAIRARFLTSTEHSNHRADWIQWKADVVRANAEGFKRGDQHPAEWPDNPNLPEDDTPHKTHKASHGLLILGAIFGFIYLLMATVFQFLIS